MKIKLLLLALAFISVNSNAENWNPSPLTVKSVGVDMRFATSGYPAGTNARIQLAVKENSTAYYYYYDAGNAISLSKANQFLSTLLTAKSTGEGIYVLSYLNAENQACPNNGQTCFDAIQNGSN